MTDDTAYFDSESFKKLLQQYEDSVKSGHPAYMDADDLADIADYYHYEGRMDDATAAIELALQFNPDASAYLLAEFRFQKMIADIYKIIADAARINLDMLQQ